MTLKSLFALWGGRKPESTGLQLPIVSHHVPQELEQVLQQYCAQCQAAGEAGHDVDHKDPSTP